MGEVLHKCMLCKFQHTPSDKDQIYVYGHSSGGRKKTNSMDSENTKTKRNTKN